MIEWVANTSDGSEHRGTTEDGSWRKLQRELEHLYEIQVESLMLHKEGAADARIDDEQAGYFIGNKVIAALGQSGQISLVGIGYIPWSKDVVRIKWYNANNMELVMVEARPIKDAESFLIKNY